MGSVKENQQKKRQKLLETAFKLFTSKGIHETTIQDIAQEAGVAKGTFYLYFKDKYDLVEKLRKKKATKLFQDAILLSREKEYENYIDQFLDIIDYIIDALNKSPEMLKFIYKNLSLGAYQIELEDDQSNNDKISIFDLFNQRVQEGKLHVKEPKIVFFMLIELVGSTCYSSILYGLPLPIDEFKPHLYAGIRKLLDA